MRYARALRQTVVGTIVVGCASGIGVEPGVPLTGAWGGRGASLSLTASEGTVEYDCAHGTISESLVPDDEVPFAQRDCTCASTAGRCATGNR